ncbi:hypothetical protein IJG14_00575 [bacterium]|nr:hypothetical protein [bacterium]
MKWCEIFRTGNHTDSNGNEKVWTIEDLKTIEQNFNEKNNEVPICCGHPKTNSPALTSFIAIATDRNYLLNKEKQMRIYFNHIITLVQIITPYLKKITEEKIIPWSKKQYYKNVNKTVAKMIKKLAELGEKALICDDEAKKERHKLGFKLGYEFVNGLEMLVTEAKKALAEINEKLGNTELLDEDEIPF